MAEFAVAEPTQVMGGRQGGAMADVLVTHCAFRFGGREMTGDAVTVYGEAPGAAMAVRFRFPVAAVTGFFFVADSAILAVPGGANAVAFSAPCQVVAVGRSPLVAFLAGGFPIMTDQAEFHVPSRFAAMRLFP